MTSAVDDLSSARLRRAEAQVRVQRVVTPDDATESWTVLADDWAPVEPVELFLAHLNDQGRSPNTVKAYAHDLKDYFAYLDGRGADWRQLRFDELAGFKPWLRLSPAQRCGGVAALPSATPYCAASTVGGRGGGAVRRVHQAAGSAAAGCAA